MAETREDLGLIVLADDGVRVADVGLAEAVEAEMAMTTNTNVEVLIQAGIGVGRVAVKDELTRSG